MLKILSDNKIITLFIGIIILLEFCLFFHINILDKQIKIVRIFQFFFLLYFISITFVDLLKKKYSAYQSNLFSDLDLYFLLFIFYLSLTSLNSIKIYDDLLNSFIEIFKYLIYYFIYIYLFRLSKKRIDLNFLYQILYFSLFLIIVIGLCEFFYNLFFHVNFIPRQLNYGFNDEYIGRRFHSIFGEPRDAATNLMSFISIIAMLEIVIYKKIKSIFLIFFSVVCAFLTFSTTFLFLLAIFAILFISYARDLKLITLIIIFISSLILIFLFSNEKIYGYFEDLLILDSYLVSEISLKQINIEPQLINIAPLYMSMVDLFNYDLLNFLFGNGVNSSSFISYESYINHGDKPHSQFTRLIYDNGIIGLLVFIFLLNFYMKDLISKYNSQYLQIIFIFTIFLAAVLAQRTGVFFILLFISQHILISKNNVTEN